METQIERLERLETRLAIESLNADFCHYLDCNMIDELVELFTEEARYSHGLRRSCGRDEIRRLFTDRTRKGERTSRHMQTGLKITMRSPVEADGRSVCMTFACDGLPPISPATPFLVADFIDEYQYCSDGRWRIRKRHIERIFTAPDNTGPVGLVNNH
ncbi:nuclear transport factor 2 family protein [Desulfopila aestuarii]|uniref:SnoaL-like domain-containing protein n=1 Tax=Desulfopila aestuarii DSM 18488 TaxID=1121416 RepID=A0A1M7XXX0_9BACT|nr:nuclear transport factor 2 family protein [Desulfopila aestuarii]SHO43826.1 SnoaL-like domain-containing protein [Desulfopila aestuarii DSM 18488]